MDGLSEISLPGPMWGFDGICAYMFSLYFFLSFIANQLALDLKFSVGISLMEGKFP